MIKKTYKKSTEQVMNEKYECDLCVGTGYVQSEDGGHTVNCPKCEGSGDFNPY